MKRIGFKLFLVVITTFIFVNHVFLTTKVILDTHYKMSYVDYNNLDFNVSTSTDNFSKVYSVLEITLKTLIDNIEFVTELCNLGEAGTEKYETNISTTFYWQNYYPYPNLRFQPWFSQFYFKYRYQIAESLKIPYLKLNVNDINTYFGVGRQRKEFVEGLVVGDNKIGYDGITAGFNFGEYFYIDVLFSRLTTIYGFVDNKYFDLYSFLLGSKYYEEFDFGVNNVIEKNKFLNSEKIFYEFFIKRVAEKYMYVFEYAVQRGSKEEKSYSGSLWYFRGKVYTDSKRFGKSSAGIVWLLSSGGTEHSRFDPTCSKMYDDMEPYGFGEFTRANVKNIFFNLPDGYSGVFVLGLDLTLNPLSKLYTGFEYYLYSSPEAPTDKPDASSTERTLGAKKAVGLEYGINMKYEISKYANIGFAYSVFDPTANAYPKKHHEMATKLRLSLTTKF